MNGQYELEYTIGAGCTWFGCTSSQIEVQAKEQIFKAMPKENHEAFWVCLRRLTGNEMDLEDYTTFDEFKAALDVGRANAEVDRFDGLPWKNGKETFLKFLTTLETNIRKCADELAWQGSGAAGAVIQQGCTWFGCTSSQIEVQAKEQIFKAMPKENHEAFWVCLRRLTGNEMDLEDYTTFDEFKAALDVGRANAEVDRFDGLPWENGKETFLKFLTTLETNIRNCADELAWQGSGAAGAVIQQEWQQQSFDFITYWKSAMPWPVPILWEEQLDQVATECAHQRQVQIHGPRRGGKTTLMGKIVQQMHTTHTDHFVWILNMKAVTAGVSTVSAAVGKLGLSFTNALKAHGTPAQHLCALLVSQSDVTSLLRIIEEWVGKYYHGMILACDELEYVALHSGETAVRVEFMQSVVGLLQRCKWCVCGTNSFMYNMLLHPNHVQHLAVPRDAHHVWMHKILHPTDCPEEAKACANIPGYRALYQTSNIQQRVQEGIIQDVAVAGRVLHLCLAEERPDIEPTPASSLGEDFAVSMAQFINEKDVNAEDNFVPTARLKNKDAVAYLVQAGFLTERSGALQFSCGVLAHAWMHAVQEMRVTSQRSLGTLLHAIRVLPFSADAGLWGDLVERAIDVQLEAMSAIGAGCELSAYCVNEAGAQDPQHPGYYLVTSKCLMRGPLRKFAGLKSVLEHPDNIFVVMQPAHGNKWTALDYAFMGQDKLVLVQLSVAKLDHKKVSNSTFYKLREGVDCISVACGFGIELFVDDIAWTVWRRNQDNLLKQVKQASAEMKTANTKLAQAQQQRRDLQEQGDGPFTHGYGLVFSSLFEEEAREKMVADDRQLIQDLQTECKIKNETLKQYRALEAALKNAKITARLDGKHTFDVTVLFVGFDGVSWRRQSTLPLRCFAFCVSPWQWQAMLQDMMPSVVFSTRTYGPRSCYPEDIPLLMGDVVIQGYGGPEIAPRPDQADAAANVDDDAQGGPFYPASSESGDPAVAEVAGGAAAVEVR